MAIVLAVFIVKRIKVRKTAKRNKMLKDWLTDSRPKVLYYRLWSIKKGVLFDKRGTFRIGKALDWFSEDLVAETLGRILDSEVKKYNDPLTSLNWYFERVARTLISRLGPNKAEVFARRVGYCKDKRVLDGLLRSLIPIVDTLNEEDRSHRKQDEVTHGLRACDGML